MSYQADITDYDVHAALRSWLLTVIGGASFLGSTSVASLSVVSLSAGSVEIGQQLIGPGIPPGTYIESLDPDNVSYVLSQTTVGVTEQNMSSGVEIIQELDNRVPMPIGGFILLNCISKIRLSTDVVGGTYDQNSNIGTATYAQPIDYAIQLDFYGDDAGDWAAIVSTLWRSSQACDFLASSGIQPLYHDDPRQVSFVDGESQYEHRWVMTVHLQYTPIVTTSQDYFSEFDGVTLINVEATYPQ